MQIRGTLGSLNQLIICVGILAALLTNVVVNQSQWRFMFYLGLIPAALLAVGNSLSYPFETYGLKLEYIGIAS